MHISDMLNQYHNNLASGSEISTGTKGIEQLTNTLSKLQKGQIFEGTVNSVKGNQIILGLSSGQNITARIDSNISLVQGQSVFFQVKSNDGITIQIKPMMEQSNPTLLTALDAASVKVNERTLGMVDAMMQQQMSIDSKSVSDMARLVAQNPEGNVKTIVEMAKLGLPVSTESFASFENFKTHQGDLMQGLFDLTSNITDIANSIETDDAIPFAKQLETVFDGTKSLNVNTQNTAFDKNEITNLNILSGQTLDDLFKNSQPAEISKVINTFFNQSEYKTFEEFAANINSRNNTVSSNPVEQLYVSTDTIAQLKDEATSNSQNVSQLIQQVKSDNSIFVDNSLQNVLTKESALMLNSFVSSEAAFLETSNSIVSTSGHLNTALSTNEFISQVVNLLESNPSSAKELLTKLSKQPAFREVLNNLIEQNYTIKPEELANKDKLNSLYEKLSKDMNKLMQLNTLGGENASMLSKTVNRVQSNIDFMNQVNYVMEYVQIPLKLSNQDANGDLYVYQNHKGAYEDGEEVTAFLHFDLEHLGSTDISVKMKERNVDTRFYLESDEAFDIVMNNISLLEDRLNAKGYNCKFKVQNQENEPDFVEEFISKSVSSSPKAAFQRYSFDVRA